MKSIACFLLLRTYLAASMPTHSARSTAVSAHSGSGQYTAGPSVGQESAAVSSWSLTHQDAAFRQGSSISVPSYGGGSEAAFVTLKPSLVASRANPSDAAAKLSSLGMHSPSVVSGAFPALDDNVAASPMGVLSPVSVAADFAVFGSGGQADGSPMSDSPDPSGGVLSLPTADSVPLALQATSSGGQQSSADRQVDSVNPPSVQPSHPTAPSSNKRPGSNSHAVPAGGLPVAQQSKTTQQPAGVRESLPGHPPPPLLPPQVRGPAFSLQYNVQQDPNAPVLDTPAPAALLPLAPPAVEQQLRQTNLFVMGLDKPEQQQQHTPDSLAFASVNGTAGGPKSLSSIPGYSPPVKAAAHPATELRVPCHNLVDALFVLDDVSNAWLVRESLRHYSTQLLASPKARFGAVLCGNTQTFYTNLQSHFSVLVASLEDLQHANATLDPSEQMPDTPGYRGDNNPYPPRVSEDFALSTAGCLETVFHLLSSSNQKGGPVPERLVSVMGTKERWSDPTVLEEARFLRSLNFSLLTLADGRLSAQASDTLRNMASTPDKFRTVIDNVTMHALPAMIGNAVCRPHKADVTIVVQRTQTMKLQEPSVSGCRQVNGTTLQRTTDFGRFFGTHVDYVTCPLGAIPNLQKCSCAQ